MQVIETELWEKHIGIVGAVALLVDVCFVIKGVQPYTLGTKRVTGEEDIARESV